MLGESWLDLLIESVGDDSFGDNNGFTHSRSSVEDYTADWSDFSALEAWARHAPNFDSGDAIAGDPFSESHWWNYQGSENSCAVVAQQGVLESILHQDISRAELTNLAEERGWYDPVSGTPIEDVGKILEEFDIPTKRGNDFEFTDIYTALASGEKVIVGLNANEIWKPLEYADGNPMEQEIAGHAVWLTGLVEDGGEIFVVVNDSAPMGGYSEKVELKHFLNAWDDFGNFAVMTEMNT